jgi:hypothetical protein
MCRAGREVPATSHNGGGRQRQRSGAVLLRVEQRETGHEEAVALEGDHVDGELAVDGELRLTASLQVLEVTASLQVADITAPLARYRCPLPFAIAELLSLSMGFATAICQTDTVRSGASSRKSCAVCIVRVQRAWQSELGFMRAYM